VCVCVCLCACAGKLLHDIDVFEPQHDDPANVEMTSMHMSERGNTVEKADSLAVVVVSQSSRSDVQILNSGGASEDDQLAPTDHGRSVLPLNPLFSSLSARSGRDDSNGGDGSAQADQRQPDTWVSWPVSSVAVPSPMSTYQQFVLDDGTPYFVHTVTQESVWELPQGAVLAPLDE
jgi:hypothetical protein